MINKLECFLNKHHLLNNKITIMVGFSGGYDSSALLHMLSNLSNKYNFKLCAAHLNHNWRKEAADTDEQNCKAFCEKIGVDFYSEKLDSTVPQTETAAREARYLFFERAAKHFNTNILLTAHTKSDNTETVLYRIVKGTGTKGLQGIEETRKHNEINIYRPLLDITREQIEKYCKENNLSPNNDLSNFDTKYKRNYIRHEVLPILKQINPKAEQAINSLSQLSKEQEEIINEYLTQIKANLVIDSKYKTQAFLSLSEALQARFVYDFVTDEKLDYDRKKITEILYFIKESAISKSGKTLSLSTNLWLFCNSENFYKITDLNKSEQQKIIKIDDFTKEYKIDNKIFSIEKVSELPKSFPKEKENCAIVNFEENQVLELRHRTEGDIIQPFGLSHTIKLKKYFINKGIAQHQKNKIVLLCNSTEVLWAAGVGLSEKARATQLPAYIIRIREV